MKAGPELFRSPLKKLDFYYKVVNRGFIIYLIGVFQKFVLLHLRDLHSPIQLD